MTLIASSEYDQSVAELNIEKIFQISHVFSRRIEIETDNNTPGKLSQVPPRRYRLNGCDRYPELPVMVKN